MTDAARFELALTAESLARWATARDDRLGAPAAVGASVPMSYFVFLRMQPLLGRSIHEWLDRDPDRGMYGGASYRRGDVDPRVGRVLTAESVVTDRKDVMSPRGRLLVTTLTTTYRDRGAVSLTEVVRMVDLPDGGGPSAGGQVVDERSATGDPTPLGSVSRRQIAWMTVETGDMNPLHLDASYARLRGFPDVVAPAPLINAKIEHALGRAFGPLESIDLRFQAPTFPDVALTLATRRDGASVQFQVACAGRTAVVGKAVVTSRGAP